MNPSWSESIPDDVQKDEDVLIWSMLNERGCQSSPSQLESQWYFLDSSIPRLCSFYIFSAILQQQAMSNCATALLGSSRGLLAHIPSASQHKAAAVDSAVAAATVQHAKEVTAAATTTTPASETKKWV